VIELTEKEIKEKIENVLQKHHFEYMGEIVHMLVDELYDALYKK
jgi:hypothetical protein